MARRATRARNSPKKAQFSDSCGGNLSLPVSVAAKSKISVRNRVPDVGVRYLLYASVAFSIRITVKISSSTLELDGHKMRL